MSPEASELAALRLAPAQCGYIGHPQTSGFPTLDYFLSGELIEPPNGQDHYRKAREAPNTGFHYEPLELPPVTVTREELGLRPDATAYWCAQSLFKYLPQHDEVFPAHRARGRRLPVRLHSPFRPRRHRAVPAAPRSRLRRAGLKADDHCVFLDGMDMSRFAAASAQCDLMLDSIGWSGGNTTLEALAQDLPVVTFQGELMRGRVSAGILRMMGMPETIAETIDDYVALAVRIGRDAAWRAEIKARVASDKQRLYRDRTCIAALEDFLDRAARAQPRQPRSHARRFNPASLDAARSSRGACARRSWLALRYFSWLANAEKRQLQTFPSSYASAELVNYIFLRRITADMRSQRPIQWGSSRVIPPCWGIGPERYSYV